MKVVTWNVNSIRTRLDRLLGVLERHQPDVLCLQELKCVDEKFPADELREAGYYAAVHGQKTYNGVAILSTVEPQDVRTTLGGDHKPGIDGAGTIDEQARAISAEINGTRVICVYVPNGHTVGSDKWIYKLAWFGRLRAMLARDFDPAQPLVLCGDFNVAPDDTDVTQPANWAESVLCVPEIRDALAGVADWGLVDTIRTHHPDGGPLTWWDYRQLAFPKGNGLRIDHIFATHTLADRCTDAQVDRDERKGKQPSDHAPVIAEFSDA